MSVEKDNIIKQSIDRNLRRAEIKTAFKDKESASHIRRKMPSLMSKPDKSVQFASQDTEL